MNTLLILHYKDGRFDRWHELEAQAHTSMPVISDPHTALLVAQVIELDKVKQTLKVQENRLTQIELQIDSNIDYMTISAYAKSIGLKCPTSVARSYGKIAVAVSKKKGINVGQVSDERWGVVKTYHINVLKEVFKD